MITRRDGKQFFTFDCHSHTGEGALISIFLENGERKFSVDDMVANMNKFGCDMAVTFGVAQPHTNYIDETMELIRDSKKHNGRIYPFFRCNPWFHEHLAEDIDYIFAQGAKGVKLHPQREGFYAANDRVIAYPMYEALVPYKATFLAHSGEVWCNTGGLFADAAIDFPDLNFIIGHCGFKEYWTENVAVARRHDNIYLDITELWPTALIGRAVELAGKEKVLFGTDQPYIPLRSELEKTMYYANCDDDAQAHIFGLNLLRIMGVEQVIYNG